MSERRSYILGLIKAAIQKVDSNATVILFGSRATGAYTKHSDWDVLVLAGRNMESKSEERAYREALFQVELDIGEPISTLVLPRSDWESRHATTPLYRNIQKEGIQL